MGLAMIMAGCALDAGVTKSEKDYDGEEGSAMLARVDPDWDRLEEYPRGKKIGVAIFCILAALSIAQQIHSLPQRNRELFEADVKMCQKAGMTPAVYKDWMDYLGCYKKDGVRVGGGY